MSLKKLSEKSKEFNLPQENIDKRENGRLSFISKFPPLVRESIRVPKKFKKPSSEKFDSVESMISKLRGT